MKRAHLLPVMALLWAGLWGAPALAQCRQALAVGLDVSGSVDGGEYQLQLLGLAKALIDPEVQGALLAQPGSPVYLAVFEWSEPRYQRLLLDWTVISDRQTLEAVSARLSGLTRRPAPPGTALGSAMRFGADLLITGPECGKRTLDISGDGKNNFGVHPREIRRSLARLPITLNALVIGADAPPIGDVRQVELSELSAYFRAWVIMGADAFVETALGFEDYQSAMTRKLLRELENRAVSSLSPRPGIVTGPVAAERRHAAARDQ
jgi:uncharacterized protein DUF1194